MKLLVCGGRDFNDRMKVFEILDELNAEKEVSILIEGGAAGADSLAYAWAVDRQVPEIRQFNALWDREGKKAGTVRNARMLRKSQPDALMAFPGGVGTGDMIRKAHNKGYLIYVLDDMGDLALYED